MSTAPGRVGLRWFKSSRSTAAGECVEVAVDGPEVAVRDSRDPQGPVLRFSGTAWRDFIAGVRTGSFDTDRP